MAFLLRRSLLRAPRVATTLIPAPRRTYVNEGRPQLEESDALEAPAGRTESFVPSESPATPSVSEGDLDDHHHSAKDVRTADDKQVTCVGRLHIPVETVGRFVEYIKTEQDHLVIKQPGRRAFTVLYHTLRDACHCSQCVDQSTKQRNFRTTDIPFDIKPRSIQIEHKNVKITWDNDIEGHQDQVSHYGLDHIKHGVLKPLLEVATSRRRWRLIWNNSIMKENVHWVDYNDFMKDSEEFAVALRNLAEMGLIFVKNIPDSRAEVEKIATRLGPLRNTFYGPTWDVRNKPNAENVAYTNQFLNFHMDLMYMNEPPGFQLLHCLQNSCDGGESLFSDTFHVARSMANSKHASYMALTQLHLAYEYNHENHLYTNTWPVFELDHAPRTPGIKRRLIRVNYSPPFQSPITHRYADRDTYMPGMQALKYFAERLQAPSNVFELKMEPGQCAIFENRRVAHARRGFNTSQGERWLAGAYVDEDAVLSRIRTVCRQKDRRHVWQDRDYGHYLPRSPNQESRNKNPDVWKTHVWSED
ncbi:putative Gamma-butyrobetaine hydroxylase subfamily [Aspergillus homomorphus CBS 101889]|uniref:Clavaminate synthase-like protein n=1 Tax=Aspergillus homomorphus (strain CBS 101889) TaxID=1450537 RepID=A0A395I0B1_ASPHC|nr:Clavaminate synthase-like protein [Aspergillus homomorphus CBS 101889]RAL13500.1 Clavaminate synthase-like protein [Aspergillus homomorphus CBS 101889]